MYLDHEKIDLTSVERISRSFFNIFLLLMYNFLSIVSIFKTARKLEDCFPQSMMSKQEKQMSIFKEAIMMHLKKGCLFWKFTMYLNEHLRLQLFLI